MSVQKQGFCAVRPIAGGTQVLVDRHPAGGYLKLTSESDLVALYCHWPFDLKFDQWIDINNHFRMTDYLLAVDNAMADGNGEAQGIAGGFLKIRSQDDGFVIAFSRPEAGWLSKSLELPVKRPVRDLVGLRSDGNDEPASV
jgi:hypothetical protein